MKKPSRKVIVLFCLTALIPARVWSQRVAGDSSREVANEEVVTLEEFNVNDIPIEENILPTARPFSSVYGSDRNIIDTPRNVTIISRAQLDAISIKDVRDFSKLTSSSYTRSNFGAPANPDLRTQIADTFVNGMRRGLTSNGNGLPVNFNAIESVNIVKGPASVVHGASMYVGGYADLVTKRPYFDRARGQVTATVGQYSQLRWNLDYGAPVGENTAYRFSYTGENSGSYYDDGKKNVQALYGAMTFNFSEKYSLFLNGEIFWANYTENFGINRPTQDLIDNGMYIPGVNNNPAPDENGGYVDENGDPIDFGNIGVPAGDPAPRSNAQNSAWVVTGFPVVNRMDFGTPVALDRSVRLLRPGDDATGHNISLQAIQTYKMEQDKHIVNNTYFNYIERDTLSSYLYSEIIDPSWGIENRTEYRYYGDRHQITTGVSLYYQRVKAYNDFFQEPANVWDLTLDPGVILMQSSVNYPNGSAPVPGWEGRVATPGVFNGDTTDSTAFQVGPFYQHDWKISEQFSFLFGGRVDFLNLDVKDPLKPSFIASADDTASVSLLNYNASLLYKPQPGLSFYATYNYSENPGGAVSNGGGFGQLEDGDGDGVYTITESRLQQESTLVEVGFKTSLLEEKLFVGGAIYHQIRTNLNIDGSISEFEATGFEVEGNYQPTRNFFLTLAYSYTDSVTNEPVFDVNNTSPLLPGQTPFYFLEGEQPRQGVPDHLFSGVTTYKFTREFGVSVGAVITSSINNNVAGTLVIPTQFNLDTTVFYETESWGARLALLNTTNQKNWSPPNQVYGGESIVAELPFRAELTVMYRF
ncbi:MAG: TonB-dependent receptor [Verrucomicrobia bacterium]|nr:MAG: TonB-dependent receptor [Verrucomicrobiota bacterium]